MSASELGIALLEQPVRAGSAIPLRHNTLAKPRSGPMAKRQGSGPILSRSKKGRGAVRYGSGIYSSLSCTWRVSCEVDE
jgi:hypothetical protein